MVAIAVFLIYGISGSKTNSLTKYDGVSAPSGLLSLLNTPNTLNNAIGVGVAATSNIQSIKNSRLLTLNGKPEILYIGAEYCPYCAGERWAMVIALSRFGNFSNLRLMTSNSTDYSPNTATFTFYNSTYSSSYISFVSVEQTTNNPRIPLQQLNQSQQGFMNAYDPQGSIPFLLFANRSTLVGASFDPKGVLYGKNWTTIAAQMQNASTLQSEAIVGAANLLTALICKATNNTPSNVCSQPYVTQIQGTLR